MSTGHQPQVPLHCKLPTLVSSTPNLRSLWTVPHWAVPAPAEYCVLLFAGPRGSLSLDTQPVQAAECLQSFRKAWTLCNQVPASWPRAVFQTANCPAQSQCPASWEGMVGTVYSRESLAWRQSKTFEYHPMLTSSVMLRPALSKEKTALPGSPVESRLSLPKGRNKCCWCLSVNGTATIPPLSPTSKLQIRKS